MLSVRFKLTLVLLITSFVAIAAVGMSARWFTVAQFNEAVADRAVRHFAEETVAYFSTYGSWEKARQAESFHAFAQRSSPRPNRPPPPSDRRPPRPEERGPNRRLGPGPGPPPFFLIDPTGLVLLDLAGHRVGEQASPAEIERGRPITYQDSLIALAVVRDRPVLTQLESRYLDSIEAAWVYSLLAALVLALPIGLVLGNLFSAPIKELHKAMMAMEGGQLKQLVRVRSNDEIGQLSAAFNQMSANLAGTHDKLEASRSRLREQAEALEELSRKDPLTQLFNRRAFDEQVANLFAQARRLEHPLTLAMIDIDYFKKVNDDFSHAVGDTVLREVARLLSSSLRQIDLVARYGGEEFVIAFPATAIEGANHFAERLRAHIAAQDWQQTAPGLKVTVSIGLAERASEEHFEAVLSQADAKLYQAKNEGRNRVCY